MTAPAHRGRRDNGLASETFAPVADVDPRLGDHLLDVLGLREIPAYVEPAPAAKPVVADRLFVATGLTAQARLVLSELANELGIQIARGTHPEPEAALDPLEGIDTDAEFEAIMATMPELDSPLTTTVATSLYLTAEPPATQAKSAPEDFVEHFIPPVAPPLPRLSAATALGVLVTLFGIVIIALGGLIGLPTDLPLPLGVLLVLFGGVLLFRRLRREPDDDPDDGAVV